MVTYRSQLLLPSFLYKVSLVAMARVFVISPSHSFNLHHFVNASSVRHLASFTPLIRALFKDGNSEKDVSQATVVVIDTLSSPLLADDMDSLSYEQKCILLQYFFSHTNLIIVPSSALENEAAVAKLDAAINSVRSIIGTRISRVAAWTGTGGIKINDAYTPEPLNLPDPTIIPTMACALYLTCNLSGSTELLVKSLRLRLVGAIDFKLLLSRSSDKHLAKLCHCVGHWAFPAHELTIDDLVYCVYLMFDFALQYVISTGVPDELEVPTPNELLSLAFMTRDTYKSGNPFHNFRHAVDVLQACFFYLIRLKCLPSFEQYESDPKADETLLFNGKKQFSSHLTLKPQRLPSGSNAPLLNPIQSLGLLVAALGHDVGHPGVTNAFMIKHAAPTSQIYNERSVLELYHSAIFINKLLRISWPSLLDCKISAGSKINVRHLISSSILATDMAEHFEYIHKLEAVLLMSDVEERVQLICSLLIKCADISNVTRPLRVSSHWALILSREFEEVDKLEKRIDCHDTMVLDVDYPQLPALLQEILETHPFIHKGQIFFITTFAEGLFNSILDRFPELKYTSDIIKENKLFWQARAEKFG